MIHRLGEDDSMEITFVVESGPPTGINYTLMCAALGCGHRWPITLPLEGGRVTIPACPKCGHHAASLSWCEP